MGAAVDGIGGGVVAAAFDRRGKILPTPLLNFCVEILSLGTMSKDCRLAFKVSNLCVCTVTIISFQIKMKQTDFFNSS